MKRFMLAVVLAASTMGNASYAGDHSWNYSRESVYPVSGGYYPAPEPAPKRDYPILKKVLIGGALVGLGYAAGRLTAPRPQYDYYGGPDYDSGHWHARPHHDHRYHHSRR